ncbi:hypothetical protein CS542_01950 [Pedobacter sp. IW39]|nr:hypothetical protein CS542_01950 [Pedobacter sp. IW39]
MVTAERFYGTRLHPANSLPFQYLLQPFCRDCLAHHSCIFKTIQSAAAIHYSCLNENLDQVLAVTALPSTIASKKCAAPFFPDC